MTIVPDGHRVEISAPSVTPRVSVLHGGAVVAQLGLGSDEMSADLDQVLRGIDAQALGPVLLATRATDVTQLFAPAEPEVVTGAGLLVWVVDALALAAAPDAAALVQRWLRELYQRSRTPLAQCVYVHDAAPPRARVVCSLVDGLGIPVHELEPPHRAAAIAVARPDGRVLTVLSGVRHEASPATSYARTINEAKDEADAAGLAELVAGERDDLMRLLAPRDGSRAIAAVPRAPRLRRLLLAADDERRALYDELSAREIPLLVMTGLRGEVRLRSWPGGAKALAAYPDHACLARSVRELGLAPDTFAIAEMVPRELFAWASKQAWTVAINVYTATDQPEYVPIPPDDVRALAR